MAIYKDLHNMFILKMVAVNLNERDETITVISQGICLQQ